MPERELDDIASKMPSERGSSTEPGGRGRTEDEDEDEYSEEAAEAISELTSADESDRLEASYSLDLEDESLLDEVERGLQEKLRDDDPDVRAAAARSLGEIGSEDSVDALREASKDKVRAVSNAATEALREVVNSDGRRLSQEKNATAESTSEVEPSQKSVHDESSTVTEGQRLQANSSDDPSENSSSVPDESNRRIEELSESEAPDKEDIIKGSLSDTNTSPEEKEVSDSSKEAKSYPTEDLEVADLVLIRMTESDNPEINNLVWSSTRQAISSYPETLKNSVNRYIDLLNDSSPVIRRYGSKMVLVVSEEEPHVLKEEVRRIVNALEDEDGVVRKNIKNALENLNKGLPREMVKALVEEKRKK